MYCISNYYAEAVLTPTPGSSKIVFVPGPYDANESASFDDLAAAHVIQVYGGVLHMDFDDDVSGLVQVEALKRARRANGFQVEAVQILEGSEC